MIDATRKFIFLMLTYPGACSELRDYHLSKPFQCSVFAGWNCMATILTAFFIKYNCFSVTLLLPLPFMHFLTLLSITSSIHEYYRPPAATNIFESLFSVDDQIDTKIRSASIFLLNASSLAFSDVWSQKTFTFCNTF